MADADTKKLDALKRILQNTGGVAVAFSGGLDSTLLAAVAQQELGDNAVAVTATSPLYPQHELREAIELAKQIGIRHHTVVSNELDIPGFADNPPNRCYLCKTELFEVVRNVALEYGITAIADGTNADDAHDFRPGRRAAIEQNVLSPLLEAGLGKADIRALSRKLGLPTADKPAFACLASRFPYGSRISERKLAQVGAVEGELRRLGFAQFRVRHHGDTARIEVLPADIGRLCEEETRGQVTATARQAGFLYVTVDLEGYRTGSMNESLSATDKGAFAQ